MGKNKHKNELKSRWAEIELKMKFSTCDEAEKFWDKSWTECPVCLAKLEQANPLWDDSFILIHKSPDLIRN